MKIKLSFLSAFSVLLFLFIYTPHYLRAIDNDSAGKQNLTKNINAADPENIFSELKNIYLKWNTGLFKSVRYYKKHAARYILDHINKEIKTDYRYRIISPEGLYGKKLVCNFYIEDWLQINGEIDKNEISKIIAKDAGLLTKFWRSQKLLSVSGVIRNYKFETSNDKVTLILYLENIKLYESAVNDTGKNNK